jgi:hypothetical protein
LNHQRDSKIGSDTAEMQLVDSHRTDSSGLRIGGVARRREAAQLICGGASWAGSNQGSPALLVIEISQLAKSVDPGNVNV